MGFFDKFKRAALRRKVVAGVRSRDWGVAESAIKQVPDVLDANAAVGILVPLSRGAGSRFVGSLTELPATPTYEFSAGVHLGSAIAALGRVDDPRASARLIEIVRELPGYASRAFDALGNPRHTRVAAQLVALCEGWGKDKRERAAKALWAMQDEAAFESYIKIQLKDGTPFSEDTMRRAWRDNFRK